MRQVFRNQYEFWQAWQDHPDGKGRCNNLRFENDWLYSYEKPVAHYIPERNVLLCDSAAAKLTQGWGHTPHVVSAHKYWAHGAKLWCVNIQPVHVVNHQDYHSALACNRRQIDSARARWRLASHCRWSITLGQRWSEYCNIFNLPEPMLLGLVMPFESPMIQKRLWGDVLIPRWLADKRPEQYRASWLKRLRNVEVRKAFIARFPGGMEKILHDLDAQLIDERPANTRYGEQLGYRLYALILGKRTRTTAWRKTETVQDVQLWLWMRNPSTSELHIERVHPACGSVQDAIDYRHTGRSPADIQNHWTPELIT